ncbi:MAG: hypothetical protein ACFCBU_11285 [Cyanophyceae cyanobacterium]
MNVGYEKLCGITGGALLLLGAILLTSMVSFVVAGQSPIPTDGVGQYFVGFTGSVVVVWGASLQVAARNLQLANRLAPISVIGMVLMAFYRVVMAIGSLEVRAWIGWLPLFEAALFGVLAIAFWWGRPKLL